MSATPPQGQPPTVGGERPPVPLRRHARDLAPERGRVIAVFGPRGAGKTKLATIAHEESRTSTVVVGAGSSSWAAIELEVEKARAAGAEVVFLDGVPRTADEVQWLYDTRLVSPASGLLVRIERNAALRDEAFMNAWPEIDKRAIALSMPYYVVRADDMVVGVLDLLARAGVMA